MALSIGSQSTVQMIGKVQLPVGVVPSTEGVTAQDSGSREATDVAPHALPAQWQVVEQWRRKQAVVDYKMAEDVRTVLRVLLNEALEETKGENGEVVYKAKIDANQAHKITQAMINVQKVQRLALGLSTDNLGLPPPDSHVEKNVTPKGDEEPPIPTFVVEMSSKGRFLRPRPRRVS